MDKHPITNIDHCRVIDLERHQAPTGTLTVAQNSNELPFAIRRIFYIYDVPAMAERGGHSHYEMEEMIVAATGCFDVTVSDGHNERTFTLRNPSQALYIPAGLWRTIENFSAAGVALCLSSTLYDEADYVREYNEFLKLKGCQ